MNLALACGDDPAAVPRAPSRGGAAASFVFRRFDLEAPRMPDPSQLRRLRLEHPDALLLNFPKGRRARARDLKWLGSHRYAVLHLHGDDEADLQARFRRACETLGWPPAG
jgi:hypothetical protein